jgi:predicted secreted protein
MAIATNLMVYGIIWWLVFFIALPIGVRTAEEAGEELEPGNAESAPVKPRLWLKAGITTLVAGLLWGLYYVIATYDLLGFRDYVGP